MWNKAPEENAIQGTGQGVSPTPSDLPPAAGPFNLGEIDLRVAELMLPGLGWGWSATRHEDYDGQVTLLLENDSWASHEPDENGDLHECFAFALHRSAAGVQLGLLCDDHYRMLGCFETVGLAMHRACRYAASHPVVGGHTHSPVAA